MGKVIFVINESLDGGFEAEALGLSIFTEGETCTELKENIIEAVACHFDDNVKRIVRMHFVKDELLTPRKCRGMRPKRCDEKFGYRRGN